MNSKEMFALFLRAVGVLGILFIVRHALNVAPLCTTCPVYLVIKWMIGLLVCLYLIRGAPLLVKFAYPGKPGNPA